jgi:diguanylate cyclase (GGDEF)-like protein/PAS domain S-box-containing protein
MASQTQSAPRFARLTSRNVNWALAAVALILLVLVGRVIEHWRNVEDVQGLFAWLVPVRPLVAVTLLGIVFVALLRARRHAAKLAEEISLQLRDTRNSLAEVQQLARLGDWSYKFDTRSLTCSEQALHLFGFDPAGRQPSYARCLRQVHRRDRLRFQALVGEAARRGRGFEMELRTREADGRLRWLHFVTLPMVDEFAQVFLLRGTVMDVTERKRKELCSSITHEVTRHLAEREPIAAVTPRIVESICTTMAWDCGVRWSWDAEHAVLACNEGWSVAAPEAQAFLDSVRSGALVSDPQGLLRRVVDGGAPLWVADAAQERGCAVAAMAARSGLRGIFAFPVITGAGVIGSMVFFSRDRGDADEELLATLRGIGSQIGLFCERREAEAALRHSQERLHGIVHAALDAIVAVDETFKVVVFNPAAEKIFACSAAEAIGSRFDRFIPERLRKVHEQHVAEFINASDAERKPGETTELVALRADGVEFPVEASISKLTQGDKPLYSVMLKDISDRKRDEARLTFLANYDPLTSLPNRNLFNQRLQRALARAQRFNKCLAVLFIDLDRFKYVNDTLGHATGDAVLQAVANRLMGCLRQTDTVARLGGDEFAVLVEEIADTRFAGTVARKLLAAVAQPVMLGDQEYHITMSIGISTCPADGRDGATLLKNADIAMYRAKEHGRNNLQFYTPAMNAHSLARLSLESGLRHALERGEFVLHYQPKVNIASARVTGMEALVRWNRPQGGLVPPGEFISLAEETGLIVPIGEWVLRAACERNRAWQREGLAPLRVAVNLSARQFAQASLVSEVARVLDAAGLDPELLELEITESMIMEDPQRAIQTLRRLKSMGIALAIDDFGTGYSSLGYLKRFPIDHIKIDRSFVKDIPGSADDMIITRTIIAMTHNLRLKAIAEGVETQAQHDFLREHGCDELQGYFFSRPLPERDFLALVLAHQGRTGRGAAYGGKE